MFHHPAIAPSHIVLQLAEKLRRLICATSAGVVCPCDRCTRDVPCWPERPSAGHTSSQGAAAFRSESAVGGQGPRAGRGGAAGRGGGVRAAAGVDARRPHRPRRLRGGDRVANRNPNANVNNPNSGSRPDPGPDPDLNPNPKAHGFATTMWPKQRGPTRRLRTVVLHFAVIPSSRLGSSPSSSVVHTPTKRAAATGSPTSMMLA